MIKISNYVIYHLHSDYSLLDSTTKSKMYIEKAKELNMTAIGESNHGNVFNWIKRKQLTEESGLKYIHAQEFYITETLEEKIRDNYHTVLIARNWEGVKELNRLSSLAYQKDNHFYYDPRISIDELINTSENIICTSACVASPLYKGKEKKIYNKYLQFFIENKHRCFLEIQPHFADQQREYNIMLYELHKKYSIPLIVGTDTHSLNNELAEARKILMQSKNIQYTDEDYFDLTFKSYDELVTTFEKQNCLPREIYLQAIDNTNLMADMVEEFELDKSNKYPRLYENAEEVLKEKINSGVIKRGINKLESEKKKVYYDRIKEEFKVYKKVDAIDYILLQKNIIDWCHANGIFQGPGRGSVTGSLIAYVLSITDMDSVEYKLNFFRFLNPERISAADIDIDFPPSKRDDVINYVASIPQISFSEIVTFNTVANKGAIRDVGRALQIPLSEVDQIAKNYESNEEEYRKKYPKLFKYVDLLKGVNVSVGSHPSGFVVSPIDVNENIGTFRTSNCKYPVSQCDMKAIDSVNYIKLDILGLDNIEIINKTCELANIKRITPDNIDVDDDNVWNDIAESGLAIFQMEGKFAHDYLAKALAVFPQIKKRNNNIDRISLMSMVNGAIRPSGESFRDKLVNGEFNDNGHSALNKFLSNTQGFLVYQEQIMEFLNLFCGFSMAESDSVRRKIGKKLGTEDIIPEIRERFIKTMKEKYNLSDEETKKIVEPFLQIILDASSYGFSLNHSQAYSFIGYMCGYLRHYFPLEFLTVLLNVNKDNIEKTAEIIKYAKTKNIKILPIKFRKSRSEYNIDKTTNSIYKGLSSVKHLNSQIAEELYQLKDKQYNSFIDLLVDIKENTSVNSKQMQILIKLNFFDEFGSNKTLLNVYEYFEKRYKKTHKEKTKIERINEIKEYAIQLDDERLEVKEQLFAELEYLGYLQSRYGNDPVYHFIIEIDTKYTPKIKTYCLSQGIEYDYKIYKKTYKNNPLKLGNIIRINDVIKKPKYKFIDGKYIEQDETEEYIRSYKIIKE